MTHSRQSSRRKSAAPTAAAASEAAAPAPAATQPIGDGAASASDSVSPPAIADGSVRNKMRAHALRHGRSRSLTREAQSASPPALIHADDDDDDPTRPAWGLGGRNRAISNVDGPDSPASMLSRALCCAGGRGSLSWLGLAIVTSALALLSLGIHLLLDLLGDRLEVWSSVLSDALGGVSVVRSLTALGTLLVLVAVPLTHGVVGVRRHGYLSYTFWQPFVGGLRFVLLQVLAWTIWTITVLAGAYAAWVGTKKLTTGWMSAVGVGGMVSQLLVLISLHFFVSGVSTKNQKSNAEAQQRQLSPAPVLKRTRSEGSIELDAQTPHADAWKEAESAPPKPTPAAAADAAASVVATTPAAMLSKASASATSMWPFGSLAMKLSFLVLATLSLLLALFVESEGHGASRSRSVSLLSLLTSAILLAVPITHMLARRSLTHAGYLLFQPFKGGTRFVTLQAIAWTLWTLAFISAFASFVFVAVQHGAEESALMESVDAVTDSLHLSRPSYIPWRWISSLITSAGVGGVFSQALVLLSLKYFDSKLSHKIGHQSRVIDMVRRVSVQAGGAGGAGPTPASSDSASASPVSSATPGHSRVPSATPIDEREVYARAAQVLKSPGSAHPQFLYSPHPLLDGPDYQSVLVPSPHSMRASTLALAASHPRTLTIPSPATPGVARLHHSVERDATEQDPMSSLGRELKRALKSPLSWPAVPVDKSESVVVDGRAGPEKGAAVDKSSPDQHVLESDEAGVESSPDEVLPTTLANLSLGDWSQSFKLFAHQVRTWSPREFVLHVAQDTLSFLFVSTFYLVPLVGATVVFAPIALVFLWHPLPWYCYTLYGAIGLLYASTYRNKPSLTGSRSWPLVRHSDVLWAGMERYFSSQIVAQSPLPLEHGPYIFGFHPHGVYPLSVLWATRGPQFRAAYPGLDVDVCGATIMFYAPLLRDICMWSGGREVSGTAIRMALKQKRSILLVPGGQREMRHSAADPTCLTLVTRHRGFIRMALEHGTPLVPVLSLGETMILENVHAPRMQAYTLRTMGVGFPIWPYGRWYSPLPNPHPIVVVFGRPIQVPLNKNPSVELVEEIHKVYYIQIQQMFLEHRHMIPGFHACKLVFTEE